MKKTLRDYIRGYGYVPILLIAEHKSKNGIMYKLVKQEQYDSFYFMKGDEVIWKKYIPNDLFPKLSIDHLNNKRDLDIIKKIKEQTSYKQFVKFIKDETGEDFHLI